MKTKTIIELTIYVVIIVLIIIYRDEIKIISNVNISERSTGYVAIMIYIFSWLGASLAINHKEK